MPESRFTGDTASVWLQRRCGRAPNLRVPSDAGDRRGGMDRQLILTFDHAVDASTVETMIQEGLDT
jgi:hypothetical protein